MDAVECICVGTTVRATVGFCVIYLVCLRVLVCLYTIIMAAATVPFLLPAVSYHKNKLFIS